MFNCDYFRVAIIGVSGSCKSVALYNMFRHIIFKKPKLVIVSSTIDSDKVMIKTLKDYGKKFSEIKKYNDFNESILY